MVETNRTDSVFSDLATIFHSYVLTNWNEPAKNLKILRSYIKQTKNIDLDEERLLGYVNRMKMHLRKPKIMSKTKATLFTSRKKVRKYQLGSDFCPKCNMFKNYEKECPHCSFHEITF